MAVQRALISVFHKTRILPIAKRLTALNIEILSTGGTAKLLRESRVDVKDVSEFTGWPEMLGGRVKTLHQTVHGGLLYRRNLAEDQKQAKEHGITAIDLVIVMPCSDRKSTRLNSSHQIISYAVFCLKKKKDHIM